MALLFLMIPGTEGCPRKKKNATELRDMTKLRFNPEPQGVAWRTIPNTPAAPDFRGGRAAGAAATGAKFVSCITAHGVLRLESGSPVPSRLIDVSTSAVDA